VPTRGGWLTLALAAAAAAVGRIFAFPEMFLMSAGLVAFVIVALFVVAVRPVVLDVRRDVSPSRVHAGDDARIDLVVTSKRRTPVVTLEDPVGETRGAVVRLAPMERRELRRAAYRLPTSQRGILPVGPMRVTRTDPLGLARRATVGATQERVMVYPRIDAVDPPGLPNRRDIAGESIARIRARRFDEFAGLRAYVPGDDLRLVHWPSSARSGDLVVRLQEQPEPIGVTVVLDLRRSAHPSSGSVERAISAAASVIVAAARHGRRTVLLTSGGIELDSSRAGAVAAMLDYLTTAGAQPIGSVRTAVLKAANEIGGATVVLVTGRMTTSELRGVLGGASREGTLVVVGEGPLPVPAATRATVIDATRDGAFATSWGEAIGARRRPRSRPLHAAGVWT
jgi:uncharacterized protein (DUF58 family)